LNNIEETDFPKIFLQRTPLIDVRAPVEFHQGSLPGAVNLPLMDDVERAAVGATYKQSGQEAAIRLGHELVSGGTRETRLRAWLAEIQRHPETVLYCFRGGLRSQITQRWLRERGVERPLIVGGYKKVRQYLREQIEQLSQKKEFVMLSGPTGSAKTHILSQAALFYPAVDLEALAHHRGSAFGAREIPQPSQIDFENRLAAELLRLESSSAKWLFEDESRLIGRCVLPDPFFKRMRVSDVIFVEESFDQRVENIFLDYIVNTPLGKKDEVAALALFAKYRRSTETISRKLGGVRTQEVLQDLALAEQDFREGRGLEANKSWIAKLLHYYYDPLYLGSLERRAPKILFKGKSAEILDMLKSFRAGC
jgi:tRNA 2-selenouridine synthase